MNQSLPSRCQDPCEHSDLGQIAWLFLLCKMGVIPHPLPQGEKSRSSELMPGLKCSAKWILGTANGDGFITSVLQGDVNSRSGEGVTLPGMGVR